MTVRLRLTEDQYQALVNRQSANCGVSANPRPSVAGALPPVNPPPMPAVKPPKYRNKRCEYKGRKFDSKRERNYFIRLENEKAAGMIRGFAHQVTLPLPSGKRRMRIDFMVNTLDNRIRWLDAKGFATKDWLVKRDELEHHLGIRIECV